MAPHWLKCVSVTPLGGYRLRIRFTDGKVKDVDLEGYVPDPLTDPGYFSLVSLDPQARTAAWPNGMQLTPSSLYLMGEDVPGGFFKNHPGAEFAAMWEIIRSHARRGEALPPYCNSYLITVADALLAIDHPGKEVGKLLLDSLQLDSGRDFSSPKDRALDMEIFFEIKNWQAMNPNSTLEAAFLMIESEFNASSARAKKAYYRINPSMEKVGMRFDEVVLFEHEHLIRESS